jgi:hypothetical protein
VRVGAIHSRRRRGVSGAIVRVRVLLLRGRRLLLLRAGGGRVEGGEGGPLLMRRAWRSIRQLLNGRQGVGVLRRRDGLVVGGRRRIGCWLARGVRRRRLGVVGAGRRRRGAGV